MTAAVDSGGSEPDRDGGVTARVIPESEHPIREQDIDLEALKVLYRLRDAGFSGYLVGGGVRDLYLGKRPKDFDISTNARPGQLRKLFRNSRTIGRRFRLVQVFFRGNKIIEVSTLRSQSEYDINEPDKVLPSNNTFGTLEEDAFRRDLTINSLFYEIETRSIIDYVHGVEDLDQGVIRIVGEPQRRITRDPVRMMRAVRHAARNDFTIEKKTWQAIVDNRDKLTLCPPSRIRDELLKDLRSGASRPWAEICIRSGLWFTLFPFYRSMLTGRNAGKGREELLAVLAVLDRLYSAAGDRRVNVPEYMLFAAMLLPWACHRFDLPGIATLKGAAYSQLMRAIRAELDQVFGEQFNVKRMTKETIATLFVHLVTFRQHHRNGSWPKWLEKKSYFADCSRFYGLYQEARGGPEVDVALFADTPADEQPVATAGDRRPGSGSRGRRGINPAFSSRKRGVFGLRKG
ncbi:MAG TPA: polya polymerase [Desulfobulbus sp.]|nr:polya polymerase [Desulfobulbus sp.]